MVYVLRYSIDENYGEKRFYIYSCLINFLKKIRAI